MGDIDLSQNAQAVGTGGKYDKAQIFPDHNIGLYNDCYVMQWI